MHIKYGKASNLTKVYCDDVDLVYWIDWECAGYYGGCCSVYTYK